MLISGELVIPAGTSLNSPIQAYVRVKSGTITNVSFRPAYGPNWEVYCRMRYREVTIFPYNDDEWIALEGTPVNGVLNWDYWDDTYDILVEGCSPQARFSHTVQYEIELAEKQTIQSMLDTVFRTGAL